MIASDFLKPFLLTSIFSFDGSINDIFSHHILPCALSLTTDNHYSSFDEVLSNDRQYCGNNFALVWPEFYDNVTVNYQDPRMEAIFIRNHQWMENCLSENNGILKFKSINFWSQLYLGRKGLGRMGHRDVFPFAFYQMVLSGRKQFWLCPPEAKIPKKYWENEDIHGNIDLRAFAETEDFNTEGCYMTIATAGDVVWSPARWFHETMNLETVTLAVYENWLHAGNYEETLELWKESCKESFHSDCQFVEKCEKEWKKMFEQSYDENKHVEL